MPYDDSTTGLDLREKIIYYYDIDDVEKLICYPQETEVKSIADEGGTVIDSKTSLLNYNLDKKIIYFNLPSNYNETHIPGYGSVSHRSRHFDRNKKIVLTINNKLDKNNVTQSTHTVMQGDLPFRLREQALNHEDQIFGSTLVFNGAELDPLDLSNSFADLGINNGCTLDLVPVSCPKPIKITINPLTTGKTFTVNAAVDEPVDKLRQRIWYHSNIPMEKQRLIYKAKPMSNDMILSDFGIGLEKGEVPVINLVLVDF